MTDQENTPNIEELLAQIEKLTAENKRLQEDVTKYEQIAKSAQSQYVLLKYDFDSLVNRTNKEKGELEQKGLVDTIKKMIPFIEQLKKTVENIPEEFQGNQWTNGVVITNDNINKKLNEMGIIQISSVGEEPNHDYHEPVGFEETTDDMKGKIVREFETCYVYRKGENETVIKAAKVIVGN